MDARVIHITRPTGARAAVPVGILLRSRLSEQIEEELEVRPPESPPQQFEGQTSIYLPTRGTCPPVADPQKPRDRFTPGLTRLIAGENGCVIICRPPTD